MPADNRFQHQQYPPSPSEPPQVLTVSTRDAETAEFSELHSTAGVSRVLLVHGTFLGDDPVGIVEMLKAVAGALPAGQSILEGFADAIQDKTRPLTSGALRDVANFHPSFRERFQQLVGSDPVVELPEVTWSSQNHHLARADLAVRLLVKLQELAPQRDERILLWGHSHAGNAFALLTNLLANHRDSVKEFFASVGPQTESHWWEAQALLASSPSPLPLAQSVCIAAFGTPVRYGWDTSGCRTLVHVLHHREVDPERPCRTAPLFPPHNPADVLAARYGDWVQAFAVAGTDTTTIPSAAANERLGAFLERNLTPPQHGFDTRFLTPQRVRDVCARWKTGTRCHSDGIHLLLDYEPSGRRVLFTQPVELSALGHGVATTVTWLPVHLKLVMDALVSRPAAV